VDGLAPTFTGPLVQEAAILATVVGLRRPDLPLPVQLSRWLQGLTASVIQQNGWLPAVAGARCLVALFIDVDGPAAVERALSTALAARKAAAGLRLLDDHQLQISFGVNLGPVALVRRPAGRGWDWSADGGAMALAERLALCLQPGMVISSWPVYRAAEHAFRGYGTAPLFLDELSPRRGGHLPESVYVIEGRKRPVVWRHSNAATPLLGRELELRCLCEAWRQRGDGRVVHLIGEPGSGKSKLLEAFAAWLEVERSRPPALRAWGACYGSRPFEPVAQLLEELCATGPSPNPFGRTQGRQGRSASRVRPAAAVSELGGRDPEAVGSALGRQLRDAVVIVDDLHWADDRSLAALGAAVREWRHRGCLAILSYRPSLVPPDQLREPDTRIVLPPLAADATRALAAAQLGALANEWADMVAAASKGNPLYVEEAAALIRAVGTELPPRLFDLLLARIDQLAKREIVALEREASSTLPRPGLASSLASVRRAIEDWLDRIDTWGPLEMAVLLQRLTGIDLRLRLLHWRTGLGVALNDRLAEARERLARAPAAAWRRAILAYVDDRGDVATGLQQAMTLAERAERRGELSKSAELYQLVLELWIDGALPGVRRDLVLRRLGAVLNLLGEVGRSKHAYRLALEAASDPAAAASAAAGLVRAAPHVPEAAALLRRARRLLAAAEPLWSTEVWAELALAAAALAASRGAGVGGRALRLARAAGREDLALEAARLQLLSWSRTTNCWPKALARLLREWSLAGQDARSTRLFLALAQAQPSPDGGELLARRYMAAALRAHTQRE
jgi:energy-coupling factor transporter ATP-binding protein EcfA2